MGKLKKESQVIFDQIVERSSYSGGSLIVGANGSGKTFLANEFKNYFTQRLKTVVCLDFQLFLPCPDNFYYEFANQLGLEDSSNLNLEQLHRLIFRTMEKMADKVVLIIDEVATMPVIMQGWIRALVSRYRFRLIIFADRLPNQWPDYGAYGSPLDNICFSYILSGESRSL